MGVITELARRAPTSHCALLLRQDHGQLLFALARGRDALAIHLVHVSGLFVELCRSRELRVFFEHLSRYRGRGAIPPPTVITMKTPIIIALTLVTPPASHICSCSVLCPRDNFTTIFLSLIQRTATAVGRTDTRPLNVSGYVAAVAGNPAICGTTRS